MRRLLPLLILLLVPGTASALDKDKIGGCVADGSTSACKETFYGGDYFGAVFIDQTGRKHRYTVAITRRHSSQVLFKKTSKRRFVPIDGLAAGRYVVRWKIGGTQVGRWAFRLKVEPEGD